MTLGKKLRLARQDRGLTQAQVVGETITRNMLSQIENDQAKPSVRTLEYLADVLGVEIGWLMRDDEANSAADRMRDARACYREGDLKGCLDILRQADADDEAYLLISLCASALAQEALDEERFTDAENLAHLAEDACAKGLYAQPQILTITASVLLRCAERQGTVSDEAALCLQERHQKFESGTQYHLAMARHRLLCGDVQAAEREVWSVADVSDEHKAEYLLVRGRIAVCKQEYEEAALTLRQAQACGKLPKILQRELYAAMEVCCRETEDFKNAYVYAAKQREL